MKKKPEKQSTHLRTPDPKKDLKVICIIPAREGSTGLLNKNMLPFMGRFLAWHSIDVAQKCNKLDRIVVSTDSASYKDTIEGQCGRGLVPFLRPTDLSGTGSPISKSILYTLDKIEKDEGESYDILLLLEPTSPIRILSQINESIANLIDNQDHCRAIVSVVNDQKRHPLDAIEKGSNNEYRPYGGGPYPEGHRSRQSVRPVYFMDGSFYLSFINTYRKLKSFTHSQTRIYEVQGYQSMEIDYKWEFIAMEGIAKALSEGRL
jgi:N-acylneuraminate cytidylyltransferase/CMP-N,N'-diacetyllegionaminic acid synthase